MANKKVSQLTSKPSVLVTDLFPIADPSTGQLYKTTISDLGTAIGSGVSSVNGLVGAVVLDTDDIQELVSPTNKWFTDTRARAALSVSSPLAYNSGTGVFSIPAATSSQNGYLTSTDWTTFNSKQAALSGTGFVKISGTTISYDNNTYLTTSAAASTYLALGGGTLTGNLLLPANNTVGGTNYYIGQVIATSDFWRIYGNTGANDQGELVFAVGDNGQAFSGNGQRFRFFYDAAGAETPKNALIIDYNDSTFLTTLTANSFIKSGGTSGQFLKADGSVDSSTYLTTGTASSTYLPLAGGTLTGALSGTSASFSNGLSINATQETWFSGYKVFQNNNTTLASYLNATMWLGFNYFTNSAGNDKYRNNGFATAYNQVNGQHIFYTAASGTAGNTITFSPSLTLSSTGAATFSSSIMADSLIISNSDARIRNSDATGRIIIGNSTTNTFAIFYGTSHSTLANQTVFANGGVTTCTFSATGTAIFEGLIDGKNGIYQRNASATIASNTFETYNGGATELRFNFPTSGSVAFNNGSTRLGILSNGTILIGASSAFSIGFTAVSNGQIGSTTASAENVQLWNQATSGNNTFITFYTEGGGGALRGNITYNRGAGLVSYNVTSDYRLKTDLQEFNGNDILNKINIYDYKLKETGNRVYGVMAHELAEVLPYSVTGIKDGKQMQGVDYSKIVPVMVQAIKELKAKIDILENK
jgi:hypothetical protein